MPEWSWRVVEGLSSIPGRSRSSHFQPVWWIADSSGVSADAISAEHARSDGAVHGARALHGVRKWHNLGWGTLLHADRDTASARTTEQFLRLLHPTPPVVATETWPLPMAPHPLPRGAHGLGDEAGRTQTGLVDR